MWSFSVAVSSARAALWDNTSRHAMLNLSRHLHDWIAPVVYASGEDARLLGDGSVATEELEVEIADEEQVTKLVGRDFDLLRFDRALLEYGVIYLSGAAGVGKSAFIQTALETWPRTNFCDTILVVNLVSLESRTPESLARHILGALVDEDADEAIIARVAESEEEQELQRALIDIFRSRRSVLIFDNLHFTHCGLPARYLAFSLGDAEQKDIADFLAQMACINQSGI
jgi:AAA domain